MIRVRARMPARMGCALATAVALCTGVRAEPLQDTGSAWIITLGATSAAAPRYLGARFSAPVGIPSIGVRKLGEPQDFGAQEDGFDYTLYGTKTFQIGPVANLRGNRTAGSDPKLTGLKKYATTVDAGVFANLWPVEDVFRIRLEVRQGLRPDDGIVADLNGDLVHRIGAFTLSGGPRLSFGDAAANRLELGVSPLESLRNGLVPAFAPHAGFRTIGYGAAISYDWSPTWRTTAFHRFDRLVDQAVDSPITRRIGSSDQITLGIGLFYSFAADLNSGQLRALP